MNKLYDNNNNNIESGDYMAPAVALIESEREIYYSEIQAYIRVLKSKSKAELSDIAKKNLVKAGIIDENGDLTDVYSNSRHGE